MSGHYTVPDEAVKFVKETGCDSLAIAIGNSHGAYKFKGEQHLDLLASVPRTEQPAWRPAAIETSPGEKLLTAVTISLR